MQGVGPRARERESHADSALSMEPHADFNPRTQGGTSFAFFPPMNVLLLKDCCHKRNSVQETYKRSNAEEQP